MSKSPVEAFQRAQTDQRIRSFILLAGIVGSLVMAFPMMIGFKGFAGLGGGYVFAVIPVVVAIVLANAIVFVRRRFDR
jgi:hypothetical protein